MKVASPKASCLAQLEAAISRPPAHAGVKLRPERMIADALQVGRQSVRSAIRNLVERGVLVSQRGSGTYIRRVLAPEEVSVRGTARVEPSRLLVLDKTDDDSDLDRRRGELDIGLWWASRPTAGSLHSGVLRALQTHMTEAGHRVARRYAYAYSDEEFVRHVREEQRDGYIVDAWQADAFMSALGDRPRPPIVWLASATVPVVHEPTAMLATNESIARAVRILTDSGNQRIGLIALRGFDDGGWPQPYATTDNPVVPAGKMSEMCASRYDAYDREMHCLGHSFRWAAACRADNAAELAADIVAADVDALYISDDTLLPGIVEGLTARGRQPGRDIALITLAHQFSKLPPGHQWSRMEIDYVLFAETIAETLLRLIQSAGARASSLSVHPAWIPGSTHHRQGGQQ